MATSGFQPALATDDPSLAAVWLRRGPLEDGEVAAEFVVGDVRAEGFPFEALVFEDGVADMVA